MATYIYVFKFSTSSVSVLIFSSFVLNSVSLNCKSYVLAVSVFYRETIFVFASSCASECSFDFFY